MGIGSAFKKFKSKLLFGGDAAPEVGPSPRSGSKSPRLPRPTREQYLALPRRQRMAILRDAQKRIGLDWHPGEPYWLYEGLTQGRVGDVSLKLKNRKAALLALEGAHRA